MGGIFLKIRSWWEVADRTQRVVTIFGSAFLVLILGGTFYFASKPKMALAYGGLTPGDQGRVVAEVQKMGIPVEIDMMGSVNVPHDKIALVHSTLAKNGVSPTSGHLGNADRGAIGIMSPKSVEEAQLNAIREGEIAQTLESLNGVSAVKVLLTTGEKNAFASDDNPPTASVTITEEGGADLSGAPAKAMASLVARAVPGLTTKNVSIVNQDGLALYDGSEAEGSSASYANKVSGQVNEARRIKRELQPLLDRFGPGNTVLTVRVEMDFDKATERREDLRVKKGTDPLYKESSDETMTGGSSGGTGAGNTANGGAPGTPPPTKAPDGNYSNNQKKVEFPYTKTNTETEKAPGTVTKISISVLANSKNISSVTPIKTALEGYLGTANIADKKFEVSVTPAEFDVSQEKVMKDAAGAASSKQTMQQVMSLLPIGALILVALMIIKSVAKVAKSQTISVAAYPGGQLVAAGVGALPQGSHVEAGMGFANGTSEGAVPAMELPLPKKKKKKLNPEDEDEWEDDEPMHVRIGRINEKVNVPLEQIKKMTKEKPEAVAMLLKSWLVEERR
jgi:flagellar biosynthesis/type III secretory pathway M-ring protein FliF/YscJ